MYMRDWIEKLHGFLTINDREILTNAGKISHELAISFAEEEYDKFRQRTIAESDNISDDFDASIKKLEQHSKKRKKK